MAGVSLQKRVPDANYSSSLALASGNRAIGLAYGSRPNEKGPDDASGPSFDPACEPNSKALLPHLTADFAGRIGCGVDVDIVFSGSQIGRLGVRQRRAAFSGA
jgi:hypothetical protein